MAYNDKKSAKEEFKEYVQSLQATSIEVQDLKEWLAVGNSIHSNPCMATDECGTPIDFLTTMRYQKEMWEYYELHPEEVNLSAFSKDDDLPF